MPSHVRSLFLCLGLLCLGGQFLIAEEPNVTHYRTGSHVRVVTHAGRTLRGQVSDRTDQTSLWLTASVEGIELANRIPWSHVKSFSPDEPLQLPRIEQMTIYQTASPVPTVAPFSADTIRTLTATAMLVNNDADAAIDGLRLWLAPLGARGNLIPTTGTVSVQLQAQRLGRNGQATEYMAVERWSQEVSFSDFTASGAMIDLPFRSFDVQSAQFSPLGIVQVRLGIASVGTFEATIHDLPIQTPHFTVDPTPGNRYFLGTPYLYGRNYRLPQQLNAPSGMRAN
jgi:hypothetical protein